MTGQQRMSSRKVNSKRWWFENSHFGSWALSTKPSDTLFPTSLLRRRISESLSPSDSYSETPTSTTPPTTSTSSSSTSVSVPTSLSQTSLFSFGPPTGLSSPRSSNLLFRRIKRGRGTSSSNKWLNVFLEWIDVFEQDDAFFWRFSKMNSKNVANRLLHGGFIFSFVKFFNVLIFTMTELSASDEVNVIFQGYIEKRNSNFPIPSFHSLTFLSFIYFSYATKYLNWTFLMPLREIQSISRLTTCDK